MERFSEKSWDQIRQEYPGQFVVFEALRSHSEESKRVVDAINVIDVYTDGKEAIKQYLRLHRQDRRKELYVVHTDKNKLDITERKWLGIRLA